MWGTEAFWGNYKTFFEGQGYRVITTNLRYHDIARKDDPDPRLGKVRLLDYAAHLEKEIAQLDEKPIIMGHSMGGLLTQILGSRDLGSALVAVTPAAPVGIFPVTPSVLQSFFSILTTWGFWHKPMRQKFSEACYSMMHLLPPEKQKAEFENFVHESGRAIAAIGLWMLGGGLDGRVDARKVTAPMLILSGKEDRITPVWVIRQIARKYKHATYKEFPNHAHWIVSEPNWEEVAEYVAEWLKKQ
ncbi:MAG: alpha/beta hydrolase [Anaerolineae bacterium]|jgi:pimeloyl-ACP methyl ester carboxylesterase|nr:alpha/beta hydrolase [Anaerolineae bacterium]MBT7070099.1 alpha/beta hydrolase [Anaerolineae bacterium]MBT7326722.1 alpha/beta hydrolase [Anaerolineae bacterium]